jgi:hypothetical protein
MLTRSLLISCAVLAPALALASPPVRNPDKVFITSDYAKRLVKAEVKKKGMGNLNWKVELTGGALPTQRNFRAYVDWGKGKHIMIAVPTYHGTVNVLQNTKTKGADRVTFSSPLPQ